MIQTFGKILLFILGITLIMVALAFAGMIIYATYKTVLEELKQKELDDKEVPQIFYYDEDKDNVYYCEKPLCGNGFSKDQPYCQGCGKANEWRQKW